MTTKVKGSTGIEFPDASVQSTAADAGPAFFVRQDGSGQGLPSNALQSIIFTNAKFDTAACFTLGVGSKFQPNVAGYYQLSWQVMASTGGAGNIVFESHVAKNGQVAAEAKGLQQNYHSIGAGEFICSNGSALIYFNGSTDYAEIIVYVGTSGVEVVAGTLPDANNTYFCGFLARRAAP